MASDVNPPTTGGQHDNSATTQAAKSDDAASPEGPPTFLSECVGGVQPIPPNGRLGYAKLSLSGRSLRQLLLICDFGNLLSLDVSNNKLTSLYPVRLAANLVLLNARCNRLQTTAELYANHKLEQVDLSDNIIEHLGDWQFNSRLRVLRLCGNRLESLEGGNLKTNSLLRELDLSCNALCSLEQLPYLKCLDTLQVSRNNLRSLKGIERSPQLVILHAEANNLESVDPIGMGRNCMLREVYLHDNDGLCSPSQLLPLQAAGAMQHLTLTPGPITSIPHWRLHVVHKLPQLLRIDGVPVTAEEQLDASEAFGIHSNIQRRVWETLISDEPFMDRRMLKLEESAC